MGIARVAQCTGALECKYCLQWTLVALAVGYSVGGKRGGTWGLSTEDWYRTRQLGMSFSSVGTSILFAEELDVTGISSRVRSLR